MQAQTVDYFNLKDSNLSLDCSDRDTNKIRQNILFLQKLDTTLINNNKHWYYYDLGMAHYKLFNLLNDSSNLKIAKQYMFNSQLYEFDFHQAIYNLALFNYCLNDFDLAEKYCDQYLTLKTDKQSKKEIHNLLKILHKHRK